MAKCNVVFLYGHSPSISLALLRVDTVRNVIGLWSEYKVTLLPNIQCRNLCNDHTATYASFSTYAQFTWVAVSLLLANATDRSLPSTGCERQAATANWLASTNKVNGFDISIMSKGFSTASQSTRLIGLTNHDIADERVYVLVLTLQSNQLKVWQPARL